MAHKFTFKLVSYMNRLQKNYFFVLKGIIFTNPCEINYAKQKAGMKQSLTQSVSN